MKIQKRKGGMKIKRRKRRHDAPGDGLKRCCYITVDSAMVASPNGFTILSFLFIKNQYDADYGKKY